MAVCVFEGMQDVCFCDAELHSIYVVQDDLSGIVSGGGLVSALEHDQSFQGRRLLYRPGNRDRMPDGVKEAAESRCRLCSLLGTASDAARRTLLRLARLCTPVQSRW